MLEGRYDCKPAVINSNIVVVGGFNNTNKVLYSVEQFKQNEKSWVYKTEIPDKRTHFCICSFKRNLYMLGGRYDNFQTLRSCFVYNMKYERWTKIADMNEHRKCAACTVYESSIVVTGGGNKRRLKSVEAYDYYENKMDLFTRYE